MHSLRYSVNSIDLKYENKRVLGQLGLATRSRKRFWLLDSFKPRVVYIGRLGSQKTTFNPN